MFKRKLFILALVLAIASSLLLAGIASAHNAGHFFLPDGTCLEVGSIKESPDVSGSNPHVILIIKDGNVEWHLDLIDGSGDQYGARYAADRGKTPILPGECP